MFSFPFYFLFLSKNLPKTFVIFTKKFVIFTKKFVVFFTKKFVIFIKKFVIFFKYRFDIDEDGREMFLSLLQRDIRERRRQGAAYLTIGMMIQRVIFLKIIFTFFFVINVGKFLEKCCF